MFNKILTKIFLPTYTINSAKIHYSEKLNIYRIKMSLRKYGIIERNVEVYYEAGCAGGNPYPWYSKDKKTAEDKVLELNSQSGQEFFI